MNWTWCDEPQPPAPAALVATHALARTLLAKLQALATDARAPLAVTAHQDLLFVAGAAAMLPWCDGGAYAAPSADAPALWLPTTRRPDVAVDLLARRIEQQHGARPMLLWPDPAQLLPLDRLLPASDAVLTRIEALWSR